MSFCSTCGKEIAEDAVFCTNCGATVADNDEQNKLEEQNFLDQTYRLLRWEAKAWRISGIVQIIVGAVYAGMFGLLGIVGGIATGMEDAAVGVGYSAVMLFYSVFFGALLCGIGAVSLVASKKIPKYFDGFYTDFTPALERCGSIGMLVFTILFNEIALVFFLINFIRIKANSRVIDRILARQKAGK